MTGRGVAVPASGAVRIGLSSAAGVLFLACHFGCPDTGFGGYTAICVDTGDCVEDSVAGTVARGDSWSHVLSDSLVVEWLPIRHGWRLRVGPERDSLRSKLDENLVIHAPAHFVPPTAYVEGWHFRNRSNTGPNEGSVNAPQRRREVVLTYDKLSSEIDRSSWKHDAVVRLEIDELELGNLNPGERAVIDRMAFAMEIVPLSDRCVTSQP